ncbi:MAG: ATP-binding cassette domain-containing protein [Nitrospirae bacterium]|nr:ATP-binding cassette domain-containing protein [Nitrospirota bacterium]
MAQIAAVYAAILIPFKMGIPLVPGYAELRPANAFPIVASLLFGPVAAWGSGFGNLIGDCFGTLSPGSVFGFLGNFCYGYLPYLLWGRLGPLSSGREPELRSWRQAVEFVVICFAASLACALVIGFGVDLLGLIPFWILTPAILFNNLVMAILLAPPLLLFLHPRVKRWGLRYEDIRSSMRQEARGEGREDEDPLTPGLAPLATPRQAITRQHAGTAEPFLAARSVSFTYAGSANPALNGLTFTVNRGESVAVMGRSGAGKSTLCYALNGLIPHHIAGHLSGKLTVDGHETTSRPVWQQAGSVGLVFQDFEAQLVSTNLEMELAFPLEHLSSLGDQLTPAEMRERIHRTLTLVGLSGLERRDPLSLSGGQRQRLVIATTLIREPALLALDEPMTDLDPHGRRSLASLLATLKAAGHTLVTAEHDPEEAASADRLCVLEHGRVAWEGAPRALFSQPDLAEQFGLHSLPLARCFAGLGLTDLPLTVEEGWQLAVEHGLVVSAAEAGQPAREFPSGRPAIIEVQRVSFEYQRGTPALSDVELTIGDGEFVAIIGQNGSGKSTLAGLLNGLHMPTRGRVLVRGQDTKKLGAGQLATTVGYVFQNPDHQIFAETVEKEVSFGVQNLGLPPEECEKRVAAALDAVGLGGQEVPHQDPFSLPKGDRQRVAVASVLATRPRILIFDEPTTGLDATETQRMMRMLHRLNQEGHTIIMITHALSLVAAYAQRCVVMREGQIVADGPTRTVFRTMADPEQSAALGLEVPPITRFAARWGQILLTVEEVGAALRRK